MNDLQSGALSLPSLPDIALKIKVEAENPDSTMQCLSEIIGTDASLAARIIKTVNSPLFKGINEIQSLQMAVSRLGLKTTKNLAISLSVASVFKSTSKDAKEVMQATWETSQSVSNICQAIAKQGSRLDIGEAALIGLTHRIGALPIIDKAAARNNMDEAAEMIEVMHFKIGMAILKEWGIPEHIVNAVSEQGQSSQKDNDAHVASVILRTALLIRNGDHEAIEGDAMEKLNINQEFINEIRIHHE